MPGKITGGERKTQTRLLMIDHERRGMLQSAYGRANEFGMRLRVGGTVVRDNVLTADLAKLKFEDWTSMGIALNGLDQGIDLFLHRYGRKMDEAGAKFHEMMVHVDVPSGRGNIPESWCDAIMKGCIAAISEEAKELYGITVRCSGNQLHLARKEYGPRFVGNFAGPIVEMIFTTLLRMQEMIVNSTHPHAARFTCIDIETYFETMSL